jgi:serine/threonine protein kinase
VAGAEPIPGYRLLEPLGSGGFGEVWKCEVPGGLSKAIKFVHGNSQSLQADYSPAEQELDALRRIKAIRHPFILSIERIEVAGGELLIVMELADRSLQEMLADYRRQGQTGIPREDLLALLLEAAEALDVMNFQHGLQHLDIKPGNLFLVSDHLKVGDFGLVNSPEEFGSGSGQRKGVTPLYAAPEILQGGMSRHSDQYSLAIGYQELLTGTLPFQGKNVRQLVVQRLTADPNLEALPAGDRPVLARALARDPEQRFPSCLDLVQALLIVPDEGPAGTEAPRPLSQQLSGARLRLPRRYETAAAADRGTPADPRRRPPAGAGATAASAAGPGHDPGDADEPLADTVIGDPPQQDAGAALPGFRFLGCLNQGQLGEIWKVEGPDGRERLARLLPVCAGGSAEAEARLVARLGALRHAALPPAEVLRTPAGRVAVVTEVGGLTLRDRFQECLEDGSSGIPRSELLGYLAQAGEALDALYQQHGLAHLGLNPRTLLIDDGRSRLTDFGLIALAWLPTGEPAGPLNARYAAPELFGKGGGPAGDQYSLALLYVEMLTGAHARGKQAVPRSAATARTARLDLGMLPASDRDVIARALSAEPHRRFPTCTALVRALEEATAVGDLYQNLPPVLPYTSLQGEPAPPDSVLPPVRQLVAALIAAAQGAMEVCGSGNFQYVIRPGPVLEHRCPVRSFTAGLRLKLDGFRRQWKAEIISKDEASFVCHIKAERTFWQRCVGGQAGLEVEVLVPRCGQPDARLSEATIRIKPFGTTAAEDTDKLLAAAPVLLESLRSYLQVNSERRAHERWPWEHPLQVSPVLPDLEVAAEIAGTGKDISLGGIGFVVPQAPPSDRVYLRLSTATGPLEFALLARVVRVQRRADGCYELGAAFFGDDAPGRLAEASGDEAS